MRSPIKLMILLSLGILAQSAQAQNFPTKPLQLVAPAAGGGADLVARMVATGLTQALGQGAIVVNRPGNQTALALQVSKASPDGHTLMAVGGNLFWLYPLLASDVPYDPVKDYAPVTLTTKAPNIVMVNAALPVNSVRELIALAKSKPGVLNFGSSEVGGSPHLAGELFKAMAQVNMLTIRYKGTASLMIATMSGEVQVSFPTISSGAPAIKSGKARALAVTTDRPTSLAPDLPTVNESGIPGYESSAAYVVFAPAKTPSAIIDRLNKTIVQYLHMPDIKEKLVAAGMDVVASTPQELAAYMKLDMDRMGRVIRENNIRVEQ